jgi:hypothetical protein
MLLHPAAESFSRDFGVPTHEEDDRRSISSANSSTTLGSSYSGKTAVATERAVAELLMVFQDADLANLYCMAIQEISIGPERLRRNLRRLFKLFAQDLKGEATTRLETSACHFVASKARYVAQCVVEEYQGKPTISFSPHLQWPRNQKFDALDPEEDDEVEEELHVEEVNVEEVNVEEDALDDFTDLRAFLVHSEAFQTFRQRLKTFVLPEETRLPTTPITPIEDMLVYPRYDSYSMRMLLKSALVAAGYLEPSLTYGMTRFRWRCVSASFRCQSDPGTHGRLHTGHDKEDRLTF